MSENKSPSYIYPMSIRDRVMWERTDPDGLAAWSARRDALGGANPGKAFPDPVNDLDWQERRNLANLMQRDRSLLTRSALVIYRCGATRPNGKVRGCLLGAVVNLKGDWYWLNQQRAYVDTVAGESIESYARGESEGWGDYTDRIMWGAYRDGESADDWEPESLSEAAGMGGITSREASFSLDMAHSSRLNYNFGYHVNGMNCPHTDSWRGGQQIKFDIDRLEREKNKTIYLTTQALDVP